MMDTLIRKRRSGGGGGSCGLAVIITVTMTCVLFFVMSATTTIVVVQANNNKNIPNVITDAIVTSLLRGQGRRFLGPTITTKSNGEEEEEEDSYYSKPIATRKLEEAEEEEEEQEQDNEEEAEEEEAEEDENEEDDEEDQGQDGNEDDMDDDNNNLIDTEFFETMASDMRDRFDSDIAIMWQTSPSEWDDETWKDFSIVGGIVGGLVACILLCCCVCCRGGGGGGGRDLKVTSKEEKKKARGKRQKQERRGRFFDRSRSEDTGDSHTDYSGSYSGHNSTNDWESPFVLIEDVEKDDTFSKTQGSKSTFKTQGSKSTAAIPTPTSPVYARRNESEDGGYAALSPLSSGSKTEIGPTATSDDLESPGSGALAPIASEDAKRNGGNSRTLTKKSPVLQEPSGGIVGETVDVWSEFLGLKKTKYNIQADHLDEDSIIDETDDEKDRRRSNRNNNNNNMSKLSSSSRKKSSMKKLTAPNKLKSPKSDDTNTSRKLMGSLHTRSIPMGSVSTVPNSAPTTAPAAAIVSDTVEHDPSVADSATAAGTIVSSTTNGTANTNNNNNYNSKGAAAETPITSNAKSAKNPRSPRKGFLKSKQALKTKKNLLRTFGSGNKNKNNSNKEPDSKEESLLALDRKTGEDP